MNVWTIIGVIIVTMIHLCMPSLNPIPGVNVLVFFVLIPRLTGSFIAQYIDSSSRRLCKKLLVVKFFHFPYDVDHIVFLICSNNLFFSCCADAPCSTDCHNCRNCKIWITRTGYSDRTRTRKS